MGTRTTAQIAAKVDAARIEADIPLLQLATKTGIPRTTLFRKLKGKSDFTIPELESISKELNREFATWLPELLKAAA